MSASRYLVAGGVQWTPTVRADLDELWERWPDWRRRVTWYAEGRCVGDEDGMPDEPAQGAIVLRLGWAGAGLVKAALRRRGIPAHVFKRESSAHERALALSR